MASTSSLSTSQVYLVVFILFMVMTVACVRQGVQNGESNKAFLLAGKVCGVVAIIKIVLLGRRTS